MKHYVVKVAPYYTRGNKNFYAYEATITQYAKGEDPLVVWRVVRPRRRDAKSDAERAQATYTQRAQLAELTPEARAAKIAKLTLPMRQAQFTRRTELLLRGGPGNYGMLGMQHSQETKERIAAKVRQRHAEGAYKGCSAGRPTKAESQARLKERARALGLPLKTYLAQLDARKKGLAEMRAKKLAEASLTPEQARAIQRKRLSLLP